jgi:hypothetical protein
MDNKASSIQHKKRFFPAQLKTWDKKFSLNAKTSFDKLKKVVLKKVENKKPIDLGKK